MFQDDLKSAKDEIDELINQANDPKERLQQEQFYQQELAPTLKRLRLLFSKIANLLNELRAQVEKCLKAELKSQVEKVLSNKIRVKIPIFATYEVLQYSIAGYLTQFEVSGERLPRKHDFMFSCECIPLASLGETWFHFVDWRQESEISQLKISLRESGLSFKVSEESPTARGEIKMQFDIGMFVPVSFEFTGNPKTGKIDLTIRNAAGIGGKGKLCVEKCSFSPEEIVVPRLLDAIIRHAVKMPSELHGLTKVVARDIYLKTGGQQVQSPLEETVDSIKQTVENIEKIVTEHADNDRQYNESVQREIAKLQREMEKSNHLHGYLANIFLWLFGFLKTRKSTNH
ncbi:MAG: hypothetical protein BWK79_00260 [Beggiatoa sp. IS2]|nr:MAG: hypothetical protein BWK79_00260 [Beggiatoa sp. IS2]